MPVFDGALAGDDRGSFLIAVFDDFKQVVSLGIVKPLPAFWSSGRAPSLAEPPPARSHSSSASDPRQFEYSSALPGARRRLLKPRRHGGLPRGGGSHAGRA